MTGSTTYLRFTVEGAWLFFTPIVSAVIPTRNRPEMVVRAALSALQQSFQQLEVVVVIDGPDPTTLHALAEIDDPRLRILALEESVGGAEAAKCRSACGDRPLDCPARRRR